MNWFMYVWIGGAILYLVAQTLLLLATVHGMKMTWHKPTNPAMFIGAVLKLLLIGAIPFINILFGICVLMNFENTVKNGKKTVLEGQA